MSLKKCRECSKEVSTESANCPHCGASAPTKQRSLEWAPCPKCYSANTQKIGPGVMGFVSLLTGSCFLWVPVIGWFVAIICLAFAVFMWFSALMPSGKITFQCKDCKEWFNIDKSELSDESFM